MTTASVAKASDEVACGESRRHHVHVYAVIRIEVAVDAPDHHHAMRTADEILFGDGLAVRLTPNADGVLNAEYAGEVTGYLVDEADDEGFVHTRSYAPTTNRKEISHDIP